VYRGGRYPPANGVARLGGSRIRSTTSAVHPVWCMAPRPASLSPWKYSWKSTWLVLDEPTSHLDPATARSLMNAVLDASHGKTVLLITHRSEGLPHGRGRHDRRWGDAGPPERRLRLIPTSGCPEAGGDLASAHAARAAGRRRRRGATSLRPRCPRRGTPRAAAPRPASSGRGRTQARHRGRRRRCRRCRPSRRRRGRTAWRPR